MRQKAREDSLGARGRDKIRCSAQKLEDLARELVVKEGGRAAFLGYQPQGAKRPFPAAVCVSVNDEVVHGIPNAYPPRIFKEGDIVSIDFGFSYKGMITDAALTVPVGTVSAAAKETYLANQESPSRRHQGRQGRQNDRRHRRGRGGNRQENNFGIIDILSGHGVGKKFHEIPTCEFRREGRRRKTCLWNDHSH